MKKIIPLSLASAMFFCCFTACNSDDVNIDTSSDSIESSITSIVTESTRNESNVELVDNPSEEYIIACLQATPNVVEVMAVTEENDPNGDLNTEGGYYSAVYFSVDLINQDDVHGEDLIDKGTDAGGCIEAYKTVEDAEDRNEYLSGYDDSWLFKAGYHTVIGTLVVHTSQNLSEDVQAQLESNIINTLAGERIDEAIPTNPPEITEITTEETNKAPNEIEMNFDDTYFENRNWELNETINYFEELGFTNIETTAIPDFFSDSIVIDVEIDTGLFDSDGFKAGDEFDPDDVVKIRYYSTDTLLTIDNCPDLATILTSKDMDYMTFANKYDGQYVKFEAYVTYNLNYFGDSNHIIYVTGGDYDGRELEHFDAEYYDGLIIRIGDRTWDNDIDKSVAEGQNVTVIGIIDASWCEYYKQLYVECLHLNKR